MTLRSTSNAALEALLTAAVPFVVGLGGHVADQLVEFVEISLQHDAPVHHPGREDQSLAGRVDQHQAAQRHRHLGADDRPNDLPGGTVNAASPQIERRPLPAADHPFVTARDAPPVDRCRDVGPEHLDESRTSSTSRSTPTRQCADPGDAGVACGGGTHQRCEVLGQPSRRSGSGFGQVEEVAKVCHVHGVVTVSPGNDGRRPRPDSPSTAGLTAARVAATAGMTSVPADAEHLVA
jgi:hypothetical protein